MKKNFLIVLLSTILVLFFSISFSQKPQYPYLSVSTIKNLFNKLAKEEERECKLGEIRSETGSFTSRISHEAIVSFEDYTQCHADGFQEIWLLRFQKDWKIHGKILDCDNVWFDVVDIESDNCNEVWIRCMNCFQGCRYYGYLLSLKLESIDTLFSNSGHNWGMGYYEVGDCAECSSVVDFEDVNNDNILEIIEIEYRSIIKSAKSSHGSMLLPEDCEIKIETIKSIYKKDGDKFKLLSADTL